MRNGEKAFLKRLIIVKDSGASTDIERERFYLGRRELTDASPIRVLDLGTGTGCILSSFLLLLRQHLPWKLISGVGIEKSAEACAVATENCRRLGLCTTVCQVLEGE